MKNILICFLLFSSFYFLFSVPFASAQTWNIGQPLVPCGYQGGPACTRCELFHLLKNLMDFGFLFVLPFGGTLAFIYAGVLYILSAANPGMQGRARDIFTNTMYATIIICLAWVITNTILVNLGDNVSSNWYSFQCANPPASGGQ